MILRRNVDGGEMPAAVETGQHNGIEAIGLAVVTGFSRDEGWCDDIAMEAIVS